jgi:uncharacterized protein (DUF1501 family)
MTISRRQFMIGCSAAIAAMAGSRIGGLVFDDPDFHGTAHAAGSDDILVTVFLRGGCDGLSLVSPFDDPIYVAQRGGLKVNGALPLNVNNPAFGATSSFGLHPGAEPLKDLYDAGLMAIVHGCGLDDDTRSHFDAMDYMERGTPGNKSTSTGWLTRHLQVVNNTGVLPTMAGGAAPPAALLADPLTVAMNDPRSYGLSGAWRYNNSGNDAMLTSLERIYSGGGSVASTGRRTVETIKALRSVPAYTPGVTYPSGGFADTLKTIAQMIKLDLGLRVATVDLGGWDHHESQGVNETNGAFYSLASQLASGLHAFLNDMSAYQSRLVVVVMSEFGRRLGVNASNGTDHGHGNVMLVLGGPVNGGRVVGLWPGLEDLDQDQDLRITTDYRSVLGEILVRRLGNAKLGTVFPGLTSEVYKPLDIVGTAADDPAQIDFNAPGLYLPMTMR